MKCLIRFVHPPCRNWINKLAEAEAVAVSAKEYAKTVQVLSKWEYTPAENESYPLGTLNGRASARTLYTDPRMKEWMNPSRQGNDLPHNIIIMQCNDGYYVHPVGPSLHLYRGTTDNSPSIYISNLLAGPTFHTNSYDLVLYIAMGWVGLGYMLLISRRHSLPKHWHSITRICCCCQENDIICAIFVVWCMLSTSVYPISLSRCAPCTCYHAVSGGAELVSLSSCFNGNVPFELPLFVGIHPQTHQITRRSLCLVYTSVILGWVGLVGWAGGDWRGDERRKHRICVFWNVCVVPRIAHHLSTISSASSLIPNPSIHPPLWGYLQ